MKQLLITSFKIAISVFAIWYLFKNSKISAVTFSNMLSPHFLPLFFSSMLAFFVSQSIISYRLMMLLKIAKIHISFKKCIMLTFIGNFFNIVVPGTVGGDVIKGYYLAKMEKEKKGTGSGVVIVDRIVGLLALLTIGGLSILYIINMTGKKVFFYQYNIRVVTVIIGFVLLFFFVSLIISKDERIRKKIKYWSSRIFGKGFFYQVIESFGLVTKKKRYLLIALFISILAQIFSLTGLLVFADIISSNFTMVIYMMAVSSLILLIGIIPITPGNIGWIELLASLGWSAIGSDRGAEIFLYWRAVTIICSIPGGIIYLFYKTRL